MNPWRVLPKVIGGAHAAVPGDARRGRPPRPRRAADAPARPRRREERARSARRRSPTCATATTSSSSRRRAGTRSTRPGSTTSGPTPTRRSRSAARGARSARAWRRPRSARGCGRRIVAMYDGFAATRRRPTARSRWSSSHPLSSIAAAGASSIVTPVRGSRGEARCSRRTTAVHASPRVEARREVRGELARDPAELLAVAVCTAIALGSCSLPGSRRSVSGRAGLRARRSAGRRRGTAPRPPRRP